MRAVCSDFESGAAVFDTTAGFGAVWHLSEQAGAGMARDATVNANHGGFRIALEPPHVVEGTAGTCFDFGFAPSGVTRYMAVEVDDDPSLRPPRFTVSAWVRLSVHPDRMDTAWPKVLIKDEIHQGGYALGYFGERTSPALRINTAPDTVHLAGTTDTTVGQWVLLSGTYDGSVMSLYHNGELVAQTEVGMPVHFSDYRLSIGHVFEGYIDEVRVEHTVRSAAWLKLWYENQREEGRLVAVE